MTRALALFLTVAVAGALVSASGPGPEPALAGVRLKTITSRADAKGSSLVIEATDPVSYVATQPDPLTVTLELRNVVSEGVTNSAATRSMSCTAIPVRSNTYPTIRSHV